MRWLLLASLALIACSSDDTNASCNTEGFCCCSGDSLSPVSCGSSGPKCNEGRLYKGDDCQCLPDRNTPCCLPHQIDSGRPDIAVDAAGCTGACCCQGDVQDFVQCTAAGPTCKPGYDVYYGDDCRCLPDRNTPCCYPRMFDAGTGG